MSFLDCLFGPRLFRIYDIPHRDYEPYTAERYADRVIRILDTCRTLLSYGSPIIFYNLIKTITAGNEEQLSLTQNLSRNYYVRLVTVMTSVYIVAFICRGVSRTFNPCYTHFIRTFRTATGARDSEHRDDDRAKQIAETGNILREKYDYEFRTWPVDFRWSEGELAHQRPAKLLPVKEACHETLYQGPVINMLSWIMASSIGRMMLYPGSVGLLQKVLEKNLAAGRHFLIETYHAKRFKLQARDENEIDACFVDKRDPNNGTVRGNTLVITCEGNAGFYEIGAVMTPLSLNYSVLGWNHPGFGGSTGTPFPQNDINAMEVVVNFAVTRLKFPLENILVYAWSIGGFPAAWAGSNYPELKGIIMDACFDDVLPLARARMMPFIEPLVDSTIRNFFNLNVSSYLNRYRGPVRFIRRLRDEIIPLHPDMPLLTNRGNQLLEKLLRARFPNLMSNEDVEDEVRDFLHLENFVAQGGNNRIDDNQVLEALLIYITRNQVDTYPIEMQVGHDVRLGLAKQIILFMCREHMTQFESTHCTPLPASLFKEPFNLFAMMRSGST